MSRSSDHLDRNQGRSCQVPVGKRHPGESSPSVAVIRLIWVNPASSSLFLCPERCLVATVYRHQRGRTISTATILLVRHAEHTEFDQALSGRRGGIPLSRRGHAQAARLAERLRATHIDRIEASPLERTQQTAAALAASAGVPVATAAALIEIDMGEWSGRALGSFGDDPAWRAWNEHRATARIPGGETMAEAQARIVAHMRKVAAREDGRTIALVTHSDMIRAGIAWALGLSLDNLLRFDIGPASVSRMVVGDWGAKVLSVNEGVELDD